MWLLTLAPFALQAIVMLFDEWYFHIRRGLPRWEKIGHPIDTASVIICMGIVVFLPFSTTALCFYCALAIFSCLLVTKDEFVHKKHCPASEQWLHALLFTLHPISLTMAGFMWPIVKEVDVAPWVERWFAPKEIALSFLEIQLSVMLLFLTYQIIYWNFIRLDNDQ